MAIIRHTDNDFDNIRMTAAGYEIMAIETYAGTTATPRQRSSGAATNSRSPTPISPTDDTPPGAGSARIRPFGMSSPTPTAEFPRRLLVAEGAIFPAQPIRHPGAANRRTKPSSSAGSLLAGHLLQIRPADWATAPRRQVPSLGSQPLAIGAATERSHAAVRTVSRRVSRTTAAVFLPATREQSQRGRGVPVPPASRGNSRRLSCSE